MKTFSIKKNIFIAIFSFIAIPSFAGTKNPFIYIPPDYLALIAVGGIILLAGILYKFLKRSEEKTNRIKSMRRFNRHRSLERL